MMALTVVVVISLKMDDMALYILCVYMLLYAILNADPMRCHNAGYMQLHVLC
jgi:hypothetical protein